MSFQDYLRLGLFFIFWIFFVIIAIRIFLKLFIDKNTKIISFIFPTTTKLIKKIFSKF